MTKVNISDPPAHLQKPDDCKWLGAKHHCSHPMNHQRLCSDSHFCMVAVFRCSDEHENIKPCGRLTGKACEGGGNYNATFAGCGSKYCIHFNEE